MRGLRKVIIAALGAIVLVSGAQAQSQNPASPQAQALPPEFQPKTAGQTPVAEQVTPQISAGDSAPASESPPALQPAPPSIQPRSQQQAQPPQPAAAPATAQGSQTGQNQNNIEDQYIKKTGTEGKKDQYIPGTLTNLSKLYWAVGKFTVDDNVAIDNYLRINECPIVLQYYHNDFEWGKIREATRQYLLSHMAAFPRHFEIVQEINLGNYDQGKQQFEMARESQLVNILRIDSEINNNKGFCDLTGGNIPEYPRNMIVRLTRPLTITVVPVEPRLAELYVEQTRLVHQDLSALLQNLDYKREAYLRLKIRMTAYKETIHNSLGNDRAIIFGVLEGWEVYADDQLKKPLYFHTITKEEMNTLPQRSAGSMLSLRPVAEPKSSAPQEYQPFK
jgi:hypothetical protein